LAVLYLKSKHITHQLMIISIISGVSGGWMF